MLIRSATLLSSHQDIFFLSLSVDMTRSAVRFGVIEEAVVMQSMDINHQENVVQEILTCTYIFNNNHFPQTVH